MLRSELCQTVSKAWLKENLGTMFDLMRSAGLTGCVCWCAHKQLLCTRAAAPSAAGLKLSVHLRKWRVLFNPLSPSDSICFFVCLFFNRARWNWISLPLHSLFRSLLWGQQFENLHLIYVVALHLLNFMFLYTPPSWGEQDERVSFQFTKPHLILLLFFFRFGTIAL